MLGFTKNSYNSVAQKASDVKEVISEIEIGMTVAEVAAEVARLKNNFAKTEANSYTYPTLLHCGNQPVKYTLAPINKAEVNAIPHKTLRSGKRY